ncbi:MAG: class I SAM-dependent methyltransferase [Oscillospiraceae bacterium]|nr:class I SAM-dependent methyltransferase [Oscillospiraceae bacterium]
MADGYGFFASVYDRLTGDVDYPARAAYILALFEKFGSRPETLLDLACGTGSLSVLLAAEGIDVTAVDGSAEMLVQAQGKAAGREILFLQQDMRELDLYGTVQGAVCMLDSLNHITKTAELSAVFNRLRLFIEPGGLFIFDVNTPYKHRTVLADSQFVLEQPDFLCVWRNRLLANNADVLIQLDFFYEQPDKTYMRHTETIRERAYSEGMLRRLLTAAGFSVEAVYGDMSCGPPGQEEERMIFVARRK